MYICWMSLFEILKLLRILCESTIYIFRCSNISGVRSCDWLNEQKESFILNKFFWYFSEKKLYRCRWTMDKQHESDKNKKCLSVYKFGILYIFGLLFKYDTCYSLSFFHNFCGNFIKIVSTCHPAVCNFMLRKYVEQKSNLCKHLWLRQSSFCCCFPLSPVYVELI